ncbi:MAG: helix-turn-helix domain-containing protein [Acidobacteria bacterium]|nr:helix-turn-helix domain-containing protein [Acidobacteriota bacterium]
MVSLRPHFGVFILHAPAARLLSIHHKTLQKLARRGDISGTHVGKLWRFRASALNAWLDQQKRAG